MDTARIDTHLRCNQACRFCTVRRERDDLRAIQTDAVLARIEAARVSGARDIVLSGGEPTMRRDLEQLIAAAARDGVRVTLETNATLIDADRAVRFKAAGLLRARVHVPGVGADADAATQDPEAGVRLLVGLRALHAAGIPVTLTATVAASTAQSLPRVPGALAAALAESTDVGLALADALELAVASDSPDPREVLDLPEALAVVAAVAAACEVHGLPLRLSAQHGLPPCALQAVGRLPLATLTSESKHFRDFVTAPACVHCVLREHCPGVRADRVRRFGVPTLAPVTHHEGLRRVALQPEDVVALAAGDAAGTGAALQPLVRLVGDGGPPVVVSVALTPQTADLVPELPDRLAAALGGVARLEALELLLAVHPDATGGVLDLSRAAQVVAQTETRARALGLTLRIPDGASLPPCTLDDPQRLAPLYALSRSTRHREGFEQVAACSGCNVSDRCPGFAKALLARIPTDAVKPITHARTRRRLSGMGTPQRQALRDLVSISHTEVPDGAGNGAMRPAIEELVRIHYHCNQSCRFCFVYTHLPPASDEAVRAAISAAARRGSRVTLTGGEPTLNPRLLAYIALAKAESQHGVGLQSNAIKLADARLVEQILAAGVDRATVSLHAHTPELSDAITESPGTWVQTVQGLDNLFRAGVHLSINFVICQANYRTIVDYVRYVGARWPRSTLAISFVAPATEIVPHEKDLLPRFTDVAPLIVAAFGDAQRLGLSVGGLDTMCGIPLCLLPRDAQRALSKLDRPPDKAFVHPEVCRSCALVGKCWGVRQSYVELYGAGELKPVSAAELA